MYKVVVEMDDGFVYETTVSTEFWFGVLYESLENNDRVIHYTVYTLDRGEHQ